MFCATTGECDVGSRKKSVGRASNSRELPCRGMQHAGASRRVRRAPGADQCCDVGLAQLRARSARSEEPMKQDEALAAYFADAASWDADRAAMNARSARVAWRVATGACALT